MKIDVAALGELLIDFTEAGVSAGGMKLFEQNPGGAPANLLTAVSHMGYQTAFIGKVGRDMHGEFLKSVLDKENICTEYLIMDDTVFTTLAFVQINKDGEREFSFARKPGADTCLRLEEMDQNVLRSCKIFHIGSLSLTDEPAKSATIAAVRSAKAAGSLISYDPNYRASLWDSQENAVKTMAGMIKYADLLKVSDEESVLLTGEHDDKKAAEILLGMGPAVVAVTRGGDGVTLAWNDQIEQIAGLKATAVDTTGAGDSFWGGFLSRYLQEKKEIQSMSWEEWKACAVYGNATASLCVQRRGGIPAIPKKNEVEDLVKRWYQK